MKILCVLIGLLLAASISGNAQAPKVKSGLEVAQARNFDFLKGKRVGLITNQTAVNSDLVSVVDILYTHPDVNLVALFGPEHGVRGIELAGEKVDSSTDLQTGLPVHSLYGKTRKPTPEMMQGIDVLVYDIQDIGVRSYTYISTMGNAMEAASEHGIDFVVFDRPNPIGGNYVSGTPTNDGFYSFVSAFPIPYVYGLTPGELAVMLVKEKIIKVKPEFKVDVIPLENWTRYMTFMETGLPWVPSSPHIPHPETAFYYVLTGVFGELQVLSEGVGTTIPFEFAGHTDLNPMAFADYLNKKNYPGVKFRPTAMKAYYGRDKDKYLYGVQLVITDFKKVPLLEVQFGIMEAAHAINADLTILDESTAKRHRMFDMVIGTDKIRERFRENYKYDDVKDLLEKGVPEFKEKSKQYWLYN
ncbi:DUF1343 domain-containing protein [bacterium]|nr:MAG: DUF1343 domain-containing protein [bacterium]